MSARSDYVSASSVARTAASTTQLRMLGLVDTSGQSRAVAFANDLSAWHPSSADQEALRREYMNFLANGGEVSLDRDGERQHLTASCFVFTSDFENVLLCFHNKGQFWVQLGRHLESGDESVAAAARREAKRSRRAASSRLSRLRKHLLTWIATI